MAICIPIPGCPPDARLPEVALNFRQMKSTKLSLALLFVMACTTPIQSQSTMTDLKESTLHVRGQAQIMVPPDQVSVNLGLTTEATTVREALDENTQAMDAIFSAMEDLGLDKEEDMKTQNFSVNPTWSNRPRNAGADWKSEIVGYRVNNSINVSTKKLELIGDIIAKGAEAGANQVNSVTFSLADKRKYRSQAITMAAHNAREDAEVLAIASGASIVGIKTLTLDNAISNPVRVHESRAMVQGAAMDSFAAPPIESGDITVVVNVSVVYRLGED